MIRSLLAPQRCFIQLVRHYSNPSMRVHVEKLAGVNEGIALMTMNRPEARNAFSRDFLNDFEQCLDQLGGDKSVRVALLNSAVRGTFCSGADLKERLTMNEEEVASFVERLRKAADAIQDLPMPTIAVIDGHALGGGLEMALACDLRIASPQARMGLVETKLAIIPGAGGTQRLPRIVGAAKAKELIFTARILNGTEAAHIGLVDRICGDGESAQDLAMQVAAEILPMGPIANRMAKLAINHGVQVPLEDGLAFEKRYYAEIIKTKDRLEGLRAFREKRKPSFSGE